MPARRGGPIGALAADRGGDATSVSGPGRRRCDRRVGALARGDFRWARVVNLAILGPRVRARRIALIAVLCLMALALWRFMRGGEVARVRPASGSSPGVAGEIAGAGRRAEMSPSLRAAAIAGRVRVEDGPLPPAQVCATPAEVEQDRGGWGRLSLLGWLERCVAVAEDGAYRIDGVLPGRWVVSASAEGYLPLQHRETPAQPWFALQLGQVREGLDFVLRTRGVAVRGVVRDVSGGTISGAVITDGEHARVLSGEDGAFTLWARPRASVAVAAYAAGYGQDVVMARPPQPPVTLYLTPESVLRGRVIREDTGAPLAGIAVHVHESSLADAETDTSGMFEVRALAPGRHRPYVRSGGWCGGAEPSVVLGIGESSAPITIVARPCRTVAASVRVRPANEGCTSASIELLDVAGDVVRRALTDAGGAAEISGLEPGAYSVKIRCPGRLQRAPEPWLLGEAMQAEATWYVEQGRTVRGVVRDPRDVAVSRANVEITGAWGYVGAFADDAGEFEVAGVHPGPAEIRPYHPDYHPGAPVGLEIAESSDPPRLVLRLSASATGVVRGRVRARSGELPPGLTIAAYAIGDLSARSVRVDADGSYTLPGLTRRPHRIVVQRAGGLRREKDDDELAEQVVDLEGRETAEADFVVDIAGMVELAGRVLGPDGDGEADALVTVSNSMIRHRALTDEAGRFAVQVPGEAKVSVEVTARDGASLREKDVDPGAPLTLRLVATRRVCGVVEADIPVRGSFTIETDMGKAETFSGVDARWCLPQVPVGARTFKARSQTLGAATRKVSIDATGAVPEVTLTFSGRAALRGKVVDGAGAPRVGLKVWVFDATGRLIGGNHYTDAAGEFAVDGVPAGELTVVPLLPGPIPTRDALLASGTRVEAAGGQPASVLLTVP